jgi:hypothetical protein
MNTVQQNINFLFGVLFEIHVNNYLRWFNAGQLDTQQTAFTTDMLTDLNWPTLQQRRLRTHLIFYKIIHNNVATSHAVGHTNSPFQPTFTRTLIFFFSPHTITQWNRLPSNSTVTTLKKLRTLKIFFQSALKFEQPQRTFKLR